MSGTVKSEVLICLPVCLVLRRKCVILEVFLRSRAKQIYIYLLTYLLTATHAAPRRS